MGPRPTTKPKSTTPSRNTRATTRGPSTGRNSIADKVIPTTTATTVKYCGQDEFSGLQHHARASPCPCSVAAITSDTHLPCLPVGQFHGLLARPNSRRGPIRVHAVAPQVGHAVFAAKPFRCRLGFGPLAHGFASQQSLRAAEAKLAKQHRAVAGQQPSRDPPLHAVAEQQRTEELHQQQRDH